MVTIPSGAIETKRCGSDLTPWGIFSANAAQAAIRAGYSTKTARVIGAQNLSKLNISAAIEKARTTHAVRAELNADMVIDELRKIAFANLGDYVSQTAAGEPYLDFTVLTRSRMDP